MTIILSRQKMPASRGSRSSRASRRAPRLRSSSFRRKTALPIFPQAAFGGECQISRRVSVFGRGRAASLRTPPCALRCTIARRSRVSGSSRRVRPSPPSKALSLSASRRAVSIPWTPRGSSATNCPPSSDRWQKVHRRQSRRVRPQRRRRARPARERLRRRRRGVRGGSPVPRLLRRARPRAPRPGGTQARVADPRPSRRVGPPRGHRRAAPRSTSLRSRSTRSGHRCQRWGWPPRRADRQGARRRRRRRRLRRRQRSVCPPARRRTRSSPTMPSPGTPSPGIPGDGDRTSPGTKTTA